MFGRKKDEEGLYTGDAPVTAPGFDGAEPAAYQGEPAAPAGGSSTAPEALPTQPSYPAPAAMPPAPGFGGPGVSITGGMPSDADLVRLEHLVAEKVPPQFAGMAMEQIERLRATGGSAWAPPPGAGYPAGLAPPGAPSYQGGAYPGGPTLIPGTVRTPRRTGMIGCLVAVVILAAVVGVVAYLIVTRVHNAVEDALGPEQASSGSVGVPATVTYDDATLSLTVGDAIVQPGYPWQMASAGADPVLLVDVDMKRTDSGTEPVTVIGWDWSFTPTGGGQAVTGDIIGEYQPDLAGPKLKGGQSAKGWVSFRTGAASGTLGFSDSATVRPIVSWPIAATKAAPVTGTIGTPAQGEVGAPQFTVTVSDPRTVLARSATVHIKPRSGSYLLLDVAVDVAKDAGDDVGEIEPDSFAFTPTGGTQLAPTAAAVDDAIDWTVLDAGERLKAVLAFDTAKTAGTLVLRDGAGHDVITWTISGATTTGGRAPTTTTRGRAPTTTGGRATKTAPPSTRTTRRTG